jgi:hypothetical protein
MSPCRTGHAQAPLRTSVVAASARALDTTTGNDVQRPPFAEQQQALLDHYATRPNRASSSRMTRHYGPAFCPPVAASPWAWCTEATASLSPCSHSSASLAATFSVHAADRPGCGLSDPCLYRRTDLRHHSGRFLSVRYSPSSVWNAWRRSWSMSRCSPSPDQRPAA